MNTEIEISEKVNCCFFLEIAVWTASQISLLHAFMCYTYIKLGEESIYVFVENLKGKVKFSILFSLIWCRLKSSGFLKSCNFNEFDKFLIWVRRVKNEQFWNSSHFCIESFENRWDEPMLVNLYKIFLHFSRSNMRVGHRPVIFPSYFARSSSSSKYCALLLPVPITRCNFTWKCGSLATSLACLT